VRRSSGPIRSERSAKRPVARAFSVKRGQLATSPEGADEENWCDPAHWLRVKNCIIAAQDQAHPFIYCRTITYETVPRLDQGSPVGSRPLKDLQTGLETANALSALTFGLIRLYFSGRRKPNCTHCKVKAAFYFYLFGLTSWSSRMD
jgi:hypothetical protein